MYWATVSIAPCFALMLQLLTPHFHGRFAEVEAIAVITLFSLRCKVTLKDELQFSHESFKQRKARLLNHKTSPTLTYKPLNSTEYVV